MDRIPGSNLVSGGRVPPDIQRPRNGGDPPEQGRLQAVFARCERFSAGLPPILRDRATIAPTTGGLLGLSAVLYHRGAYQESGIVAGMAMTIAGFHLFMTAFDPPHIFRPRPPQP